MCSGWSRRRHGAGPSRFWWCATAPDRSDWIAMDLFSQFEARRDAQKPKCSQPDAGIPRQDLPSSITHLPTMARAAIIETSINSRGTLVSGGHWHASHRSSQSHCAKHLSCSYIAIRGLAAIRHASAIFVGHPTSGWRLLPVYMLPTSVRQFPRHWAFTASSVQPIIYCSPEARPNYKADRVSAGPAANPWRTPAAIARPLI